jgi:hypothetical protein
VGKANEARECALDGVPTIRNTSTTVILRSRALARRLEGWPLALVAHPSRLGMKNAEHLRMTAVCIMVGTAQMRLCPPYLLMAMMYDDHARRR